MDDALIAREQPLAKLREAFERARAGRGSLVLVRGEAGIGKSALATAVAREAHTAGVQVVEGRAWELAEAPPYFPLWPLLRALRVSPPVDGASPFRLWEEVLSALAAASAQQAMLVVLEDLHAADLQTLDLLAYLVQPLRALRVLVVGTARAQDPRIGERAGQRLVRIARDGLDLQLDPLGSADVAALASRIAGRSLTERTAADLLALTGGNPLFVVECARAFRAAGAAPISAIGLPPTIRQVVGERIALLPAGTRSVLAAAAILGREASAATIARMQGTLPANVIDAMVAAIDAGIVVEKRPGLFLFTHILVRDTIEDGLPPSERAALHTRAEAALASAAETPENVVERARHALAAMNVGEHAIALGLHAAQLLEGLGAFDRALVMHERIEEVTRDQLGRPLEPAQRLRMARLAQKAGRHGVARRICEEVLRDARAAGDAEVLARAALTLGAELRPGAIDLVLVRALEEARDALASLAPPARAGAPALGDDPAAPPTDSLDTRVGLGCRVLARLAAALQPAPNPKGPVEMGLAAIARARDVGDDVLILEVLHTAIAALVDYAPPNVLRQLEEELLERSLRVNDTVKAVRAQILLALDQLLASDFAGWNASVDRALELAAQIGHPRHRWRALLLASMRAVMRGEIALSNGYIVEVQALASVTDDPALMLSLSSHVGCNTIILHRDADMPEFLEHVDRLMIDVPDNRFVGGALRCSAYACIEDRENAGAVAIPLRHEGVKDEPDWFSARVGLALALVGHEEGCRLVRARLAPFAAMQLVGGHVPYSYDGPFLRVLARLDGALGDKAAEEDGLRRCLALALEHGLRTWVAQIRYDLGRALQTRGAHDEARRELEAAAALADDIGMPGLAVRARRTASSASAAAPAPASSRVATDTAAQSAARTTMVCEGDTWRVEHQGRVVRVRDSRGMQLLARLVERPGEELHVLVLASDDANASLHDTGAGDVLDARARREYKERLGELRDAIAEAERHADLGRLDMLRREMTALEGELGRAAGLGGRARTSASASERARVNVQRRLRDAIGRLGEVDASLGRFFEKAVRTGTYCRFLT